MKKMQPAWVDAAFDYLLEPVIAECEEYRRNRWTLRCYSADHTPDKALAALNRVACSPRADDVWQAFSRFGDISPQFLADLARQIHWAIAGFEWEAITQKERKRAARKIQKLALQLAEELDSPAIRAGLDKARKQLRRTEGRSLGHPYPTDPTAFLGLAKSASVMARQPKLIGQPNSPNAARLFFIQRITKWIYKTTNTPMRSQVLGLGERDREIAGNGIGQRPLTCF